MCGRKALLACVVTLGCAPLGKSGRPAHHKIFRSFLASNEKKNRKYRIITSGTDSRHATTSDSYIVCLSHSILPFCKQENRFRNAMFLFESFRNAMLFLGFGSGFIEFEDVFLTYDRTISLPAMVQPQALEYDQYPSGHSSHLLQATDDEGNGNHTAVLIFDALVSEPQSKMEPRMVSS